MLPQMRSDITAGEASVLLRRAVESARRLMDALALTAPSERPRLEATTRKPKAPDPPPPTKEAVPREPVAETKRGVLTIPMSALMEAQKDDSRPPARRKRRRVKNRGRMKGQRKSLQDVEVIYRRRFALSA